jgi:hypothetical protein
MPCQALGREPYERLDRSAIRITYTAFVTAVFVKDSRELGGELFITLLSALIFGLAGRVSPVIGRSRSR